MLIEGGPDLGEELVPNSEDTVSSVPSYPLLYERGHELMVEWSKIGLKNRRFDTTTTHLPKSFLTMHTTDDLLRHPYGKLFFRGLMRTGVKWGAQSFRNHKQNVGTSAGHMVASIWIHLNQILPYIFEDVIWAMRQDLYTTLKTEFGRTPGKKFSGLWDHVHRKPDDLEMPAPEPTQREPVFRVPVRFALDTIAGKTQDVASDTVAQVCKLISRPEVGGIETDDGWVMVPEMYQLARALFTVCASHHSSHPMLIHSFRNSRLRPIL